MKHFKRIAFILVLNLLLMGCTSGKKAGAFEEGRKPAFNRLYPATWHTDHTKGRASNIDLSNKVATLKEN
jgi:PBP1b-binding outer membrane lipoprotein LpoB